MHSKEFKHASTSKEIGYEMVAFGDAADGSADYVLLQLASEFDEQDRKTGMDGIYLEINDQAHSGYKVVNRIDVASKTVTIQFSAQRLSLPETTNPLCITHTGDASLSPDVFEMLAIMADRAGIGFDRKTD